MSVKAVRAVQEEQMVIGDEVHAGDTLKLLQESETTMIRRLEECSVIANPETRLDQAASLIAELKARVKRAKELSDYVDRIRKRLDSLTEKSMGGIYDEVVKEGGKIETPNWVLGLRDNPPSVVVDELKAIPKRYRREPAPIPSWTKWEPDKPAIKEALSRGDEVPGAHLKQGTRLEIERR